MYACLICLPIPLKHSQTAYLQKCPTPLNKFQGIDQAVSQAAHSIEEFHSFWTQSCRWFIACWDRPNTVTIAHPLIRQLNSSFCVCLLQFTLYIHITIGKLFVISTCKAMSTAPALLTAVLLQNEIFKFATVPYSSDVVRIIFSTCLIELTSWLLTARMISLSFRIPDACVSAILPQNLESGVWMDHCQSIEISKSLEAPNKQPLTKEKFAAPH